MKWPWRRTEERSLIPISDPALAAFFGVGSLNFSGVPVSEQTALGLSGVYRAVSLISGTIAGLPLKTYRELDDGTRVRVGGFLDDPAGMITGQTRFEWVEEILCHLLLHGNAFLFSVFNQAGSRVALIPIHPLSVSVERDMELGSKTFRVSLEDGTQRMLTEENIVHIPALSTDGLRGISPIHVARNSLGTAIAGDRAAAKAFSNGAMPSGLLTPEEEGLGADEVQQIRESVNHNLAGHKNAGTIAVINRRLKLSPWTPNLADLQFIESRGFQVQEIARWYGVPPHLLMDPGAVSTWGTGVEIMNRALAQYCLRSWTSRIEQRLSRLLPSPRFAEFDFAGLIKPDPQTEIGLLIQEVGSGIITVNEARRIRGLDPVPGGDALRIPGQTMTTEPAQLEGVAA